MYMRYTRNAPKKTLRMVFHTYDVNKDGRLDPEEVKGILKVSTTSFFK